MNRCWIRLSAAALFLAAAPRAAADPVQWDLSGYRTQPGLSAAVEDGALTLQWRGEGDAELRIRLGVDHAAPVVREVAVRPGGGAWRTLAERLAPDWHVTTGKRRISNQQLNPLRKLGVAITPELIEREKWNVFWDSPLTVPGLEGVNPDLPRRPEEIRRDAARFQTRRGVVRTDGARLEAEFDGLTLGLFAGRLRVTVYRGSNLVRMEAIAKTEAPSVAYKYRAGLRGFAAGPDTQLLWRDTGGNWQRYLLGGAVNEDPVPLRARNRLAVVQTPGGSIAVFPPPHKFFFAREIELNLGYVWYRKDDANTFSVGVRHGDREEMFRPYGVSDELWEKRVRQARRFALGNFALYNAPPGTEQRMAVYFYLSPNGGQAAQQAVLRYTRGDRYARLPGYQVAVSHFHTHFAEQLSDWGGFDFQPPWVPAFRALGINIAMMSEFHGDGHPNDPGEVRLSEQDAYFRACRRHSDRDFLIMPGEEPNAHFGGHYTMIFPRPVYWTKTRPAGRPFIEQHPRYGRVYHTGSAEEELEMLRREGGLVWQAHPRTKGSTGYPDAIRQTAAFRSDRFLGASFQSLPVDLSELRLGEKRCFGVLDDMNNWGAPKCLIAEGDTYTKYPSDEIYGELAVNYVRVDPLPTFDEDWSPILEAMRRGDFFVTTGEVLLPRFAVEGEGASRRAVAELRWTFPLELVELVWGDGRRVGRRIVRMTGEPPLGRREVRIPFDATGKKWVRLAVWDTAGNGAFTQPVHLDAD